MSEHLLKACAAVDEAQWEEMYFALGLSLNDYSDIERSASVDKIRRWKVLDQWKKQAKSPTVGRLLRLLKLAKISRSAIEKTYYELFGQS